MIKSNFRQNNLFFVKENCELQNRFIVKGISQLVKKIRKIMLNFVNHKFRSRNDAYQTEKKP